MPGLDPAIQPCPPHALDVRLDARIKSGHDGGTIRGLGRSCVRACNLAIVIGAVGGPSCNSGTAGAFPVSAPEC